jgi:hypothetical protein
MNRDFEIPLSRQMAALLVGLPRLGPHVFTMSGAKPWAATTRLKRAPYEVAERVLNHAMTKLERTYNRHSYRQEKEQALQPLDAKSGVTGWVFHDIRRTVRSKLAELLVLGGPPDGAGVCRRGEGCAASAPLE